MKKDAYHIRDYVEGLAASGRYHFSSAQAQAATHASADAVWLALSRLKKQRRIASPARGFYVIVPPEYRALGCLPADQFIPALMKALGMPYYAGLLTAAQYHGAAHQRPQEFQVFLEKRRRPIECGKVRVAFIIRKRLRESQCRPSTLRAARCSSRLPKPPPWISSATSVRPAASTMWRRFCPNSRRRSIPQKLAAPPRTARPVGAAPRLFLRTRRRR